MWLTLVNIGTGATCRIIYAVYRSCVVLAEGAGGWQPPKTRPPVWWPATYLGWDAQAKQNRDFPNPWRGQWWGIRFQQFDDLRFTAQLAIQHPQKHFVNQLLIDREFGGNAQFGHFRQRKSLFHLSPFAEEVPNFLDHCLLPCGGFHKGDGFRLACRKQLPCSRRGSSFLAR